MNTDKKANLLPENAYRPLKEGETYKPLVSAHEHIAEVSLRSVLFGLFMAVVFSGACAFLGLKIGQVFEAAIPISILAVGASSILPRKSTILENVITQSVGSTSGSLVAGAIFTLPAIFILHLKISYIEMVTALFLGGSLGILFMIMFRKYFVRDMHGKLPFPEATATTEILVTGEKGGKQARLLLISIVIGALFDFSIYTLRWINEYFTTEVFTWGHTIAQKTKLVFEMNLTAALMGMGYIIGMRYSAIICAGSFLSWFVLVPLAAHFGVHGAAQLDPHTIFTQHIRLIGIGGIAAAGLIGIIKSFKIIVSAVALGFKEIWQSVIGKKSGVLESRLRTNLDIRMSYIFLLLLVFFIVILLFFRTGPLSIFPNSWTLALIAVCIVAIISFMFASVAARAIAIVGTNPVSGMTLMTLMLSGLILYKIGVTGPHGIIAAFIIGGVVCTALAMAGSFITDLKIGYWIGATPRNQERYKFLGTLISAATVGLVMILLNKTYGFIPGPAHPDALIAPQANAMAAVISSLMSNQTIPWTLYGVGAAIAVICEMCCISPLAFALGMYLPLQLNTPLLVGAGVAWMVKRTGKNPEILKLRNERGTLIASGLIAGGAIVGVVAALIKYFDWGKSFILVHIINHADHLTANINIFGIVAYFALAIFIYCFAVYVTKQKQD